MHKIEKLYEEIKELNKLDPATVSERTCKFFEEAGELAKEVNKLSGRKVKNSSDTRENVIKEISKEAADSIQNIFSICEGLGISLDDILNDMTIKNQKWKKNLKD